MAIQVHEASSDEANTPSTLRYEECETLPYNDLLLQYRNVRNKYSKLEYHYGKLKKKLCEENEMLRNEIQRLSDESNYLKMASASMQQSRSKIKDKYKVIRKEYKLKCLQVEVYEELMSIIQVNMLKKEQNRHEDIQRNNTLPKLVTRSRGDMIEKQERSNTTIVDKAIDRNNRSRSVSNPLVKSAFYPTRYFRQDGANGSCGARLSGKKEHEQSFTTDTAFYTEQNEDEMTEHDSKASGDLYQSPLAEEPSYKAKSDSINTSAFEPESGPDMYTKKKEQKNTEHVYIGQHLEANTDESSLHNSIVFDSSHQKDEKKKSHESGDDTFLHVPNRLEKRPFSQILPPNDLKINSFKVLSKYQYNVKSKVRNKDKRHPFDNKLPFALHSNEESQDFIKIKSRRKPIVPLLNLKHSGVKN